ncbi:MAG: ATP-binding protein, partial [Pseudomonadota bacterium]
IKEADRLWRFTDKTLAASHKAEVTEVNIHEVLEYVFTVISAEEHGEIKLKRDYDPSIPEVMIDREQLIQAVMNLLGNAIEAVDRESGEISIETRVLRHYSIKHKLHALVACIAIIDNGPGVPEELKDTLFYPMITGKAEGTGLGLSIAQQLTQNHGGLIEYERRNDKTCFHLYLPIGRKHAN